MQRIVHHLGPTSEAGLVEVAQKMKGLPRAPDVQKFLARRMTDAAVKLVKRVAAVPRAVEMMRVQQLQVKWAAPLVGHRQMKMAERPSRDELA